MEEDMLKMKLAAGLAAAALMTGAAQAQTSAPTQPVGGGQIMTQMPQDLMRGSRLMGIDVYGADNQKIGDIDEVLVDRQGKIHGLVVGVGGFLGIGQKDVAIPFDQVQWMSNQEVQASSNANQGASGTNTAGGVTVPGTATGGMATGNQPATTGSTAAGTTGSPGAAGTMGGAGTTAAGAATGSNDNMPARAMVKMTKADLQNAPEFRYSQNDANRQGAAGNTNPPPQSVNTPGNTPATAPKP
jgi:sporulation protein YlmC with PRC-barrel domain